MPVPTELLLSLSSFFHFLCRISCLLSYSHSFLFNHLVSFSVSPIFVQSPSSFLLLFSFFFPLLPNHPSPIFPSFFLLLSISPFSPSFFFTVFVIGGLQGYIFILFRLNFIYIDYRYFPWPCPLSPGPRMSKFIIFINGSSSQ